MDILPGVVVWHANYGTGRVAHTDADKVIVNFIKAGVKSFTRGQAEAELGEPPAEEHKEDTLDRDELKELLREVLAEEGLVGSIEIGERWEGGEMVLKPGRAGLQEKPVPIETFFHKIVMVRNSLRVLEQNINANQKLTDAEKVDLQQFITRCYGSLTTFNFLFRDKKDWFVGSKKD